MKLYIRRKTLGINDNVFGVATEDGKLKYDIKFQTLLIKQIRILDTDKNTVSVVKQELKSLAPKYSVFVGEDKVLTLGQKMHILPKFTVEGSGWEIQCGAMRHNYDFLRNGEPIARIREKTMTWGKAYEIDILDPKAEVPVVAAAVAIECGIGAENCLPKP